MSIPKNILDTTEIYSELITKYSLSLEIECDRIISKAITEAYGADSDICFVEENKVIIYYKDKKNGSLKEVVKTYSEKKIKEIRELIQKIGQREFLNKKRQYVEFQLTNKKQYFHSVYSHCDNKWDYYDLYLDKNLKRRVGNILGATPHLKKKKRRFYVDLKRFIYNKNNIVYREVKNVKTKTNFIQLLKELSREVKEKSHVGILIEYIFFNYSSDVLYLHSTHKTKKDVLEYIKFRFQEVFDIDVEFIAGVKKSKKK